jgi:peptidoglycan hydrolase CwlO-like protein
MSREVSVLRAEIDALVVKVFELEAEVTDLKAELTALKAGLEGKIQAGALRVQNEVMQVQLRSTPEPEDEASD